MKQIKAFIKNNMADEVIDAIENQQKRRILPKVKFKNGDILKTGKRGKCVFAQNIK